MGAALNVLVPRAWAELVGTDGCRAGPTAGCEGIAAAAGTGFATQESCELHRKRSVIFSF